MALKRIADVKSPKTQPSRSIRPFVIEIMTTEEKYLKSLDRLGVLSIFRMMFGVILGIVPVHDLDRIVVSFDNLGLGPVMPNRIVRYIGHARRDDQWADDELLVKSVTSDGFAAHIRYHLIDEPNHLALQG